MHATYIDTFPATWDVCINFFIVYRDSFDAKLSTEEHHGVFEVLGDAFSKLCKCWRKDKERPDGITCKYWRIAFLCSKLHKIIGTLRGRYTNRRGAQFFDFSFCSMHDLRCKTTYVASYRTEDAPCKSY